jgi:hypothetical protein
MLASPRAMLDLGELFGCDLRAHESANQQIKVAVVLTRPKDKFALLATKVARSGAIDPASLPNVLLVVVHHQARELVVRGISSRLHAKSGGPARSRPPIPA